MLTLKQYARKKRIPYRTALAWAKEGKIKTKKGYITYTRRQPARLVIEEK